MAHLNNVMLIGYASKYQFGQTASEDRFCNFKLFVVDKLGQHEKKNYFSIVCYGGLASLIEKYASENKYMLVDGRINAYQDSDGNDRYEIVAGQIKFL